MKKSTMIIIGVVVVIAIYCITSYNGFIIKRENISNQWAQIDSQLQRRYDLIPNLVATVKGITGQEQAVFGEIAEARSRYAGAPAGSADRVAAAGQIESSLARLLVITENYPQLQSSQAFMALMVQLEGTENRIAVERKNYNDAVLEFNKAVQRFPGSVIASIFGFKDQTYFQVADAVKANPQVDFTN